MRTLLERASFEGKGWLAFQHLSAVTGEWVWVSPLAVSCCERQSRLQTHLYKDWPLNTCRSDAFSRFLQWPR